MDFNNMDAVYRLFADIKIPPMFSARQEFDRPQLPPDSIPDVINELLYKKIFKNKIQPGMRIAITAGSRGIANAALIIRSIADFVKTQGAQPFLIPAMGSHGGATAEGQKNVLVNLGITEQSTGCPILSSMEVVRIGQNTEGKDIYMDRYAFEADGIIVNCRIKPHNAFRGVYESGIMKMMAIGLTNQYGAAICHSGGIAKLPENITMFGRDILKYARILFAVATMENAYDETARIVVVNACDVEREEPLYLKEAFAMMPRLLVDRCDIMIVDQIGKNISGGGMDSNITGRFREPFTRKEGILPQRLAVLDLTKETDGNANGIGKACAITKRAFDKINLATTYPNAITTTSLPNVKIPMILPNDRAVIQACIKTCIGTDPNEIRIIRIRNTMDLKRIWLSAAYYIQAQTIPGLVAETVPTPLVFDENGNLFD